MKPDRPDRDGRRVLLTLWLLAFAIMVLRHAWMSDDAFITMRCVDNWVDGRGLTWNPGERVQAFTHPLWMLLEALLYSVTDEAFFTTMALGWVLSLVAFGLLAFRVARSVPQALLVLLVAILSPSLVDYSTSGLENPLAHLLIVALAMVWTRDDRPDLWRYRWAAVLTALAALTRLDSIALWLPPLAWLALLAFREGAMPRRLLAETAAAFSPLILWKLVALVWFGFLLPNTAYAKLGTGIPLAERIAQGGYYVVSQLRYDPLAVAVIVLGVTVPFATKHRRMAPWAIGIVLHAGYVVWVGGDFMAGRFFTPAIVASLVVLARAPLPLPRWGWAAATAVCVALSVGGFRPTVLPVELDKENRDWPRGVVDERSLHRHVSSLFVARRGVLPLDGGWAMEGLERRYHGKRVVVRRGVGELGFFAGPRLHIVDEHGLGDPLLARLPSAHDPDWRPGHFVRRVPSGYLRSLEADDNHIEDRRLKEYYEHLRRVVSGPLWSGERWASIWGFLTGEHDALIDQERYRFPNVKRVVLEDDAAPKPVPMPASGVELVLDAEPSARTVLLRLTGTARFEARFFRGKRLVGTAELPPHTGDRAFSHELEVPSSASDAGYDRIHVYPVRGQPPWSLEGARIVSSRP